MYTSQEYHRGCLFQRNRYLVDHSAYCVCYLLQERTGTSYTAQYAREQGPGSAEPGSGPLEAAARRPKDPVKQQRPAGKGEPFPAGLFCALWGFTKVME